MPPMGGRSITIMVLESILISVLETVTAQAREGNKAPIHKYLVAVAGKEKAPIPGSKRLVACENKYKTDESLMPGEYIATISISAYGINGNTGESLVILHTVPVAKK